MTPPRVAPRAWRSYKPHKSWVDHRKRLWWEMEKARGKESADAEGERTFLAAMQARLGDRSIPQFILTLPKTPDGWREKLSR